MAARIGVEGVDVQGVGKAQHGDRQHRHQRLVHMHNVKLLGAQDVLDALRQPNGEGDAGDRPVSRHSGDTADGVDIAALVDLVVAGGRQDAHVVARLLKTLSQVAHVILHTAGRGEIVGADERDFHPTVVSCWRKPGSKRVASASQPDAAGSNT